MEDFTYPDQLQDVPIFILGKGKENCGKYSQSWYMEDFTYPDQLQDVPIFILGKGKENCGKYISQSWYMDDDFCAGHLEGFQDSCYRDSGGPLIAKDNVDNNGAATLFGVVSRGKGCARPGYPGIYADVPYHLQRGKFLDREH